MTTWFSRSDNQQQTTSGPSRGELAVQPSSSPRQLIATKEQKNGSISLLEEARDAIAEASTFDEIKTIRDKAEAARNYAQAAGMGLEIQNYAAEVKLRAERRAGELLKELKLHGGDRSWERSTSRLTLRDIGVSKDQSSRWQLAATVAEEEFEEFLRKAKLKNEEVTTAGLVRLAQKNRKQAGPKAGGNKTAVENCQVVSEFSTLVEEGKRFSCFYLDPPWPGEADNNSFLLALAEIPISKLADKQAHMHIWAEDDSLFVAKQALETWGFQFAACLVALTSSSRNSPYWAQSHEYLLLGTRGELPFMEPSLSSVSRLERDASGYPNPGIRKLVERVSPGPYLELFARRRVSNWTIHSSFDEE